VIGFPAGKEVLGLCTTPTVRPGVQEHSFRILSFFVFHLVLFDGPVCVRLREMPRWFGYPFDVIAISTGWSEDGKIVVGGIAHPTDEYGGVIHEGALRRSRAKSSGTGPPGPRKT